MQRATPKRARRIRAAKPVGVDERGPAAALQVAQGVEGVVDVLDRCVELHEAIPYGFATSHMEMRATRSRNAACARRRSETHPMRAPTEAPRPVAAAARPGAAGGLHGLEPLRGRGDRRRSQGHLAKVAVRFPHPQTPSAGVAARAVPSREAAPR